MTTRLTSLKHSWTAALSFAVLVSAGSLAHAITLPDLLTKSQMEEEMGIDPNEGRDLSMLRSDRLQIIIHKALENETMEVILDGTVLHTWLTSTGRNRWETPPSGRPELTETPEGRFRIFRRVKDYVSRTWKAPMSHAMFFNGGIAIHGTTPDNYPQLGTPASGGCVRLTEENAVTLWDLVTQIGTRNTLVVVTADGAPPVPPRTPEPGEPPQEGP